MPCGAVASRFRDRYRLHKTDARRFYPPSHPSAHPGPSPRPVFALEKHLSSSIALPVGQIHQSILYWTDFLASALLTSPRNHPRVPASLAPRSATAVRVFCYCASSRTPHTEISRQLPSMPIIRNPFRKYPSEHFPDDATRVSQSGAVDVPSGSESSLYGTMPLSIRSNSQDQDPAEYKLSEINDSGLFLPVCSRCSALYLDRCVLKRMGKSSCSIELNR